MHFDNYIPSKLLRNLELPTWFIWLLTSYLLISGVLYSLLIPPLQKPDENVHYKRTIMLTHGYWKQPINRTIPFEQKYTALYNNASLNNIPFHYQIKTPYEIYKQPLFSDHRPSKAAKLFIGDTLGLPAHSYLLQASIIHLLSYLKLNVFFELLLGRLLIFTIATVTILLLISQQKREIGLILLLFLCVPMTLHQLSSYSYDVMQIVLGSVVFSEVVSRLLESKKTSLGEYVRLGFFLLIFNLLKPGYEFSYFLPWLIPLNRHKLRLANLLPPLVLTGSLIIFTLVVKAAFLKDVILASSVNGANSSLQLYILKTNPQYFLNAILNTHLLNFSVFVKQAIGVFGWLDYSLSEMVIWTFLIIQTILAWHLSQSLRLRIAPLGVLTAFVVSTYLVIILVMYLTWTPVAASSTWGVQGRYFLILWPYLTLLLSQLFSQPYRKIATIALVIIIMLSITRSIYLRYFDLSENYAFTSQLKIKKDHHLKTTILLQPIRGQLRNVPSRKLRAVAILLNKVNSPTNIYEFRLYNLDCQRELTRTYASANRIERTLIFKFTPVEYPDSTFCYLLKPLTPQSSSMNIFWLRSESLLVVPGYLL